MVQHRVVDREHHAAVLVVGGFAARVGWRSAQKKGSDADDFVRVRLARLARPAVPLFLFFTVALGIVRIIGLDPVFVDTIAVGIGSPLWFLGAYLIAQALAPQMIAAHERWGLRVLAVLLAGALAFDALRFGFGRGVLGWEPITGTGYGLGEEVFGLPNILFVWLCAQQIGFWMADGWFLRRTWWQLVGIIAVGYAVTFGLVSIGGYSWSMLGNQWPPTAPLALLAIVQAAALTLLRRPLTALMNQRWMQGIVFLIGSRLMTIYLWHLPLVMILTGVQLVLPFPLPVPGSALWWWTRIPFTLLVIAVAWLLSLWLGRYERPFPDGPRRIQTTWATTLAVVLFVIPPIGIAAYGLDFPLAAWGLVFTVTALWLTGPRRVRESDPVAV